MFNKTLRAVKDICRKILRERTSQKTHTRVYAKRQGKKKIADHKIFGLFLKDRVSGLFYQF